MVRLCSGPRKPSFRRIVSTPSFGTFGGRFRDNIMDLIEFISFSRWLDAKHPAWNRAQKTEALWLFSQQAATDCARELAKPLTPPHFSAPAFSHLVERWKLETVGHDGK
jgi:hypothetical protein